MGTTYAVNVWTWTDHDPTKVINTKIAAIPPAAVTYTLNGTQHLNVFARGYNGNFIEYWWNGNVWQWHDHGLPPGTKFASELEAVTYTLSGVQRINVFARGVNGHLIEYFWNGNVWQWQDHGLPPETTTGSLSAVTYTLGGVQRINVFARGANGHLIEYFWNGNVWQWQDHGLPPGTTIAFTPGAITYTLNGIQRLNLFALGENRHLIERWWNGNVWQWHDHGLPPGMPPGTTIGTPAGVAYTLGGVQHLNLFAAGGNGHLIEYWWNGNVWQWQDHGLPSGGSPPVCNIGGIAAPVTYTLNGVQRINVFAWGAFGHLLEYWWNGNMWQWHDHGLPPGTLIESTPAAVTYTLSGVQRINVFACGDNGHLVEYWWR